MFPEVIEGESVRLRMVTPEDVPALFAYLSLPAVYASTSADPWTQEGVGHFVREALAATAEGRWCRYAIVLNEGPGPVGTIGLFNIDLRNHRAEIGYELAPEQWGKGVAVRACSVLLSWAFATGFHRIEATVMTGNARSERVLETLGFACEATLRDYKWVRGGYRDFTLWALLEDEGRTAGGTRA